MKPLSAQLSKPAANSTVRCQPPGSLRDETLVPACARRARAAFTLLELMLAVSLMAIVMSSLFAMMRTGFMARRVVGDAAGHSRNLVSACEQVCKILTSALPPRGVMAGTFTGEDAAACDSDAITFHASLDPYGSPWGDIVKLDFRLEEDDDGLGYRLIRTSTRNLLATRTQDGETGIICRNVRSFELAYSDGSDWYDSWDSTQRGDVLPTAVEIVLTLEDEQADDGNDQPAPSLRRVVLLPCAIGQEDSR